MTPANAIEKLCQGKIVFRVIQALSVTAIMIQARSVAMEAPANKAYNKATLIATTLAAILLGM